MLVLAGAGWFGRRALSGAGSSGAEVSSVAVFHYKGHDADPLIDARSSRNLWGDQYDRKLSDLIAVQEDITGAIAARLREHLSGEAAKPVAKGGTRDPEAYQLYLKGDYYWEKRSPEALEKATDYYSQAIEKHPNYAMAYVGLAAGQCTGAGQQGYAQGARCGGEGPGAR